MSKLIRAAAVLAAAAIVPVLSAPPASADSVVVTDPADATSTGADIRKVRVNHAARTVHTRLTFTDFDPAELDGAGVTIFFDADGSRPGPEFQIGLPLFEGSDWAITRSRQWRSVGNPLNCRTDVQFLPAQDAVRVEVARRCLGNPNNTRVSVKMVDPNDGERVADWAPARRTFTPWVVRN